MEHVKSIYWISTLKLDEVYTGLTMIGAPDSDTMSPPSTDDDGWFVACCVIVET